MNTTTITMADPRTLQPHPEQQDIYGSVGGEHDLEHADLIANIREVGVHVPIVVAHDTPGLADHTIISGHRRCAAAVSLGMVTIPAIYIAYPTATHAAQAHLDCNRNREKDGWVRTREASAYWGIETELAAMRRAAGGDHGRDKQAGTHKSAPGTSTGSQRDTRDAVAAKLGESGKTTELRKKLYDKAVEQSPENPSASPVAQALKSGKAVKTVAKEQGVIRPKTVKAPVPERKVEPRLPTESAEMLRAGHDDPRVERVSPLPAEDARPCTVPEPKAPPADTAVSTQIADDRIIAQILNLESEIAALKARLSTDGIRRLAEIRDALEAA